MPRRSAMRFAAISVGLLSFCLPLLVQAGLDPNHSWQLDEIAKAPVLIVGRVLTVQKGKMIHEGFGQAPPPTYAMTADIEVLRQFNSIGQPMGIPGRRLHLRFPQYDGIDYSPLPLELPKIKPGSTLILPLRMNKDPASKSWRLIGDSGYDLTIPVEDQMKELESPVTDARAFLRREIANSLACGTPHEIFALSSTVHVNWNYLQRDLMHSLETRIGGNKNRWAGIATGILATTGGPGWKVTDILQGDNRGTKRLDPTYTAFIRQILLKLPNAKEAQTMVIKNLVFNSAAYDGDSAQSLMCYLYDPVLIKSMKSALKKNVRGTMHVALIMAAKGQNACLAESLKRALKVLDNPDAYPSDSYGTGDIYGAAILISEYGNRQQRSRVAKLSQEYQTTKPDYAAFLWRKLY